MGTTRLKKNNTYFIIVLYSLIILLIFLSLYIMLFRPFNIIIDDSFILKFQIGLVFVVILLFIPYSGYFVKTFSVILVIFYILFLISMYKLNILSHSTPYTTIFEIEGVFKIQRFLSQEDLLVYVKSYCSTNGYNLSGKTLLKIIVKGAKFEDIVAYIQEEHSMELKKSFFSSYFNKMMATSVTFLLSGLGFFFYSFKVNLELHNLVELSQLTYETLRSDNIRYNVNYIMSMLEEATCRSQELLKGYIDRLEIENKWIQDDYEMYKFAKDGKVVSEYNRLRHLEGMFTQGYFKGFDTIDFNKQYNEYPFPELYIKYPYRYE